MSSQDMHFKALKEWNNSQTLRRQFPTFEFYWFENYQRVYTRGRKVAKLKTIFKFAH